ncbi:dihydroneopterin aldolase [Cerasicoccus arenae]|uniref:7,8-dihydroneopterin aldolase n=1 Tax=Cerasicoccus arenae TaxID=424488 RepID=A0A8J3DEE1_9BACT|nr:dihydroneopterin aldolase [Cerasicoccus arenae]MBK1856931.1 dihydroneopterin aldolase [Cerasicoccus arenae]GHB89902.1 7,8-dihydroneopterin aldolase [Cerasicoccus arenae]
MDKIHFQSMGFFGHHGCLDFEQEQGQRFLVDLTMSLDLRPAGQSDHLDDTVNYALVFDCVRVVMEKERYDLIEAVAERIATRLLTNFPRLQEVSVLVKKPNAPVDGDFDYVAVEITRTR